MNLFRQLFLTSVLCIGTMSAKTQTANPVITFYDVEKKAEVSLKPGESSEPMQAPLEITCSAEVDFQGTTYTNYTCEWRIYYSDQGEKSAFLTRYDDEITYTLAQAGGFGVKLYITFRNASNDEIEYECEPFRIVISESKLKCPDGFSPNGDDKNNIYHIEHKSIVQLEGAIFNRWGKRLHTFTLENVDMGWDGMVGGKAVPDGIYLLQLEAVGSEGVKYKVKKVINVLKGYTETGEGATTG